MTEPAESQGLTLWIKEGLGWALSFAIAFALLVDLAPAGVWSALWPLYFIVLAPLVVALKLGVPRLFRFVVPKHRSSEPDG